MAKAPLEHRIELLEEALLDYATRYGVTDLAKQAFAPSCGDAGGNVDVTDLPGQGGESAGEQ